MTTFFNASPTPSLDAMQQQLAQAGIKLCVTRKRVKNFNFRLKPMLLSMSAPLFTTDKHIAHALQQRLPWVISQHERLITQQAQSQQQQDGAFLLWGEPQSISQSQAMSEAQKIEYYRQALAQVMPALFAKWQPIVGATANETRIKKMRTRWGSCNTQAKRIWLSAYLPAYPIECSEYVIVHELCHLHHPNHSPEFWKAVKTAMPEYRRWHDQLAGKLC
ncbi:M48 family metallopeptidase [Psychrobacter sp. I-STPA10]|uniref:M48 family metallopeptidase n=1 Tax=Psychrobacter sp. I-STPA10 TaxID=2585769 RepID=UPI002E78707F|nr:SprT family zinc-dependent metalloprotease [Psychrobacter sp. I-STPA10]